MHVDRNVAVYRQTVLDALREVEDQLVALRILTEQQAALEAAVTASRQAERIISNQHLTGIVPYTNVVVARAAALNNAQAALDMKLAQLLAAVALIEVLKVGWEASQLPRWEYVNELSLLDLSPMLPPVACRGRNCGDSGSLPVFVVQPSYQSAANGAWAVMCDGIFR